MNPEHVLIPYQSAELPPGPWLVFAPHADDETFGMGGSLLRAAAAGISTHVVVLTDGALGKAEDADAAEVVATRRREVERAIALLGVSSLHLWQEPDRGLQCHAGLIEKVADVIGRIGAASVFFPGPLEPHPDHRMTAQVVWAGVQSLAAARRPEVYSYDISVQSPCNRLIDITAEMPAKRRAMAIYVSQNDLNAYPSLIESLNVARTFSLPAAVNHAESFYCFSDEDLRSSLRAATEAALAKYW
jgi:N-acetylglucosamine malate deacetylase 1